MKQDARIIPFLLVIRRPPMRRETCHPLAPRDIGKTLNGGRHGDRTTTQAVKLLLDFLSRLPGLRGVRATTQDGALHINISLSIAEDSSQKVGMLGAGADCSPKTGLGPVRSILPASLCEVTDSLTFRQIEILNCIAEGCSNRDIARQFTISENTVKRHLSNIFHKTGVSTRLELAVFAMAHGIVAAEVNQGETAWRTPSAAASAEQGGTERQHAPFVPLPGRQRAV